MASVNDNDIKLDNWLHIVTFDITKYVKVGGVIAIDETEGDLTVTFSGVAPNDERLHKQFLKLIAAISEPEPEPQPAAV